MPLPCKADQSFKFGVSEELGSEEIEVRQCDPTHQFTGFGYWDNLARKLKTGHCFGLFVLTRVTSPVCRQPLYLGFEEVSERGLGGDAWRAGICPNGVRHFLFSVRASCEHCRVWPEFHVTVSFREEVEPWWATKCQTCVVVFGV